MVKTNIKVVDSSIRSNTMNKLVLTLSRFLESKFQASNKGYPLKSVDILPIV